MGRAEKADVMRLIQQVLGFAGDEHDQAAILGAILARNESLLVQLRQIMQEKHLQRRLSPGTALALSSY